MPDGAQRKRDGADPPGLRDARDTGDTRETDAQESDAQETDAQETDAQRRRRRAQFLRELHEAKALRDRVQPRRVKAARMRQAMRMRTFRW
ncbi:hypothetical protein AB0I93_00540 [Streptomyces sp. NPDC049967]|uniref:hypothetical protein n=1 Tax=unclassified Streptomyces TaxID=2593676 RepID=UPI002E11CBDB|nr:hypothetical protein OG384_19495 [Streptomyces sp. NBC_01324]